jgi:hypothetical protein
LDDLLQRLDAAIEAAKEYDHFTDEVNGPPITATRLASASRRYWSDAYGQSTNPALTSSTSAQPALKDESCLIGTHVGIVEVSLSTY